MFHDRHDRLPGNIYRPQLYRPDVDHEYLLCRQLRRQQRRHRIRQSDHQRSDLQKHSPALFPDDGYRFARRLPDRTQYRGDPGCGHPGPGTARAYQRRHELCDFVRNGRPGRTAADADQGTADERSRVIFGSYYRCALHRRRRKRRYPYRSTRLRGKTEHPYFPGQPRRLP